MTDEEYRDQVKEYRELAKQHRLIIKFLRKELAEEEEKGNWYKRMYNLAIGEVGRWRTQDALRQQTSD